MTVKHWKNRRTIHIFKKNFGSCEIRLPLWSTIFQNVPRLNSISIIYRFAYEMIVERKYIQPSLVKHLTNQILPSMIVWSNQNITKFYSRPSIRFVTQYRRMGHPLVTVLQFFQYVSAFKVYFNITENFKTEKPNQPHLNTMCFCIVLENVH